ncbi:hypothetical protein E3Q24_02676 [Wallemia mellicola]|nr:hypothetical protein E3Q24_02676 [Wallemia mellicola]
MTSTIKYCLFDLDGLLIDSERMYTEVTNDILSKYGKQFNWTLKANMMGKHERVASEYLVSELNLPITVDDYLLLRNQKQAEAWPRLILRPGALKLIKHLLKHNIPIAVATGSRRTSLEQKMRAQPVKELMDLFGDNVVTADDITPGRGKPSPDTFLLAAQRLGATVGFNVDSNDAPTEEHLVTRKSCLVFEDAVPGAQAGLNANMEVIWIPEEPLLELYKDDPSIQGVKQTLSSLEQLHLPSFGLPDY